MSCSGKLTLYLIVGQGRCWPVNRAVAPRCAASASHGAGRLKSRRVARKTFTAHEARQHVEERGVTVRSPTPDLREEIPEAFRDVEKTVNILERAGIVRRVARLRPRGVLKG